MRLSFLNEEEQKYQISPSHWDEPVWYKVTVKDTTYFPSKKVNTITYRIKVHCHKDGERPLYTYLLEKQAIEINYTQSTSIFDQITLRIADVFNTLEYQVGHSGALLELLNFSEIKQKWEVEKKRLLKHYQGKSIRQYIDLTDVSVTEEILPIRLKKDPFLMSYFGPYYTDMTTKEQKLIAYDFFAGKTIQYTLNQKQHKEEPNLIITGAGNGAITVQQQQALFDHLVKKGWLSKDTQNKKTVATLQNKVTLDAITGQIKHCTTEQLLVIASQNVKTSITTIEKE